MALNDVFQARLVYTLHGQTLINTFHHNQDTPTGDQSNYAAAIVSVVSAGLRQVQSDEVQHVRVDVNRVSPLPMTFTLTVTIGAAGTIATAALPSEVAVVLTKQTGLAGRGFRGRWFFGGAPFAATADSQLLPAALTDWQAYANILASPLLGVGGAEYAPMLAHTPPPPPGIQSFTRLVSVRANPILRSQRRRQVGIGI